MISSTKNPKVAAALRLHKRAFRDEDGRFLVEGAQGVREAGRPHVGSQLITAFNGAVSTF